MFLTHSVKGSCTVFTCLLRNLCPCRLSIHRTPDYTVHAVSVNEDLTDTSQCSVIQLSCSYIPHVELILKVSASTAENITAYTVCVHKKLNVFTAHTESGKVNKNIFCICLAQAAVNCLLSCVKGVGNSKALKHFKVKAEHKKNLQKK